MVSRTDVLQDFTQDPRISTVQAPSVEYEAQDVVDTIRVAETQFEATTQKKLLNASGKDALGGGIETVITATMQNNVIEFEARRTPAIDSTITSQGLTDDRGLVQLIDAGGGFIAANIQPGTFCINFDDNSITDVRRVVSDGQLECKALVNGVGNTFEIGDSYQLFNIVQCVVSGGNVIAVDELGDAIPAFLGSAFTQIVTTRSSSAAVANLTTIELQLAEVHGQVRRSVYIDLSAPAGGDGYQQSPFNTLIEAVDYAEVNSLTSLIILGDVTLDRDLLNYSINSGGERPTIDANGFSLRGSNLRHVRINGTIGLNAKGFDATKCTLANNVEGLHGNFFECGFEGNLNVASSAALTRTTVFTDCFSILGGAGQRPALDLGGGAAGCDVSNRGYKGGLDVDGSVHANDSSTMGFVHGNCELLAGNTLGDMAVRGSCKFTDNSAGATVDTDGLIRAQIWQALIADFQTAGSFGEYVSKKLLSVVKFLGLK